jgi:hypothetical protein
MDALPLLLADVPPPSPLDGLTRATLLLILLGVVVVAGFVLLLIWLAARATRDYMKDPEPTQPTRPAEDDWSKKPLSPP